MHSDLVVGVDDLGVLDTESSARLTCRETLAGAHRVEGGGHGVYGVSICQIANGVDIDLEAYRRPVFGDLGQLGTIDEE